MRLIERKNKLVLSTMVSLFALLGTMVPAFAAGTANPDVTSAFTGLKDDVIATLGVIAALGVGVMAIFLAWKYGRKIFNQVAK